RLSELTGDPRFANTALKAIDLVSRAQSLHSRDPGIRGGIPGSAPVWGAYITMGIPNWAAKFYVDALLAKQAMLTRAASGLEARSKPAGAQSVELRSEAATPRTAGAPSNPLR